MIKPRDWLVAHDAVTPNASEAARELLTLLYDISGKHTLSGQHNFPNEQRYSSVALALAAGKTPAVYGTDWGFAKAGDKDSAYVRGPIVRELIEQYRDGSIVTICWHAVRPIEDEPVTFKENVCGKLTDAEFDELLTPGTAIHARWCAQVDATAVYLRQLEAARVPILFRPFHEMNGDWFWWGGRRGERGTKQLYRQIFDRLVHHHKLRNLVWVWNVDRPTRDDRQFVDYFPGQQYVDVLALDCYHEFEQRFYDELNALSDGKPLAISECGHPPTPDIYSTQPKWTWWMKWAIGKAQVPETTRPGPQMPIRQIVNDVRIWSLSDRGYREALDPMREASDLPQLAR